MRKSRRRTETPSGRRSLVERLEPRVLLSADLPGLSPDDALPPDPLAAPHALHLAGDAQAMDLMQHAGRREIVFIDAGVEGHEKLVADLMERRAGDRSFEVVLLDADGDGIEQIGEVLAARHGDLDAVHIVSHGTDRGIQLGSTWLTGDNLGARAASLAAWSDALGAQADLLLYGCNLAGSAEGQALIESLGLLTGTDVAASVDATGAALFGGDWELEYATGSIESRVAFSAGTRAGYAGVLDGTAIWSDDGGDAPQGNTFDGASFGAEFDLADVDGPWKVIQGAVAPTRDEAIVVGVDSSGNLSGQMWDGTAWSAFGFNDVATGLDSDRWGFDVAYESQSGDAVMVYSTGASGTAEISYRVWNGTAWSSATTITTPISGESMQLQLASNPVADELTLVLSMDNQTDLAAVWNGATDTWGSPQILSPATGEITDVNVVYEQQSGHAMVVWGESDNQLHYRLWNGTSFGPEQTLAPPAGPAGEISWTSLAADPNSDRIVFGASTDFNTSWAAVWDGSAWDAPVLLSNNNQHTDRLNIAVAFESSSGEALAAYTRLNQDTVFYQRWTSGGGWSGELAGPDFGSHLDVLTLDADPQSDAVMLSVVQPGKTVSFTAWDGNAWGTPSVQEADAGFNKGQPFLFLWDLGTAPNTAPVLDDTPVLALDAVTEDNGVPMGAVGTLISSLVDLTGGGGLDNVTDPDSGAVTGVAITAADTVNGTWHYSTDGGLGWNPLGAVSDDSARLLAPDARIYFEAAPNYTGTVAAALTFRAWDQTNGANGGLADTTPPGGTTAFSTTTDVASITVDAVNDPPAGADKTVTTDEGVAYTFTAADFGFSDPVEGDNLQAVVITTAPGAGTLRNGVTVLTGGETVTLAAITAGDLTFTPTGDGNGAGYAGFTFQVQDDGGTANGGVDTDPTANTITIDVDAVNDPPSGTNKTVLTAESTAYVFSRADFGFSDPVEGDAFQSVVITTVAGSGTLRNGATALAGGETVTVAELDAGDLVFTPVPTESGAGYATFTFQVQDDGGTANGGSDTDPTPNTISVDVGAVNNAPSGADRTISTDEGTPYVFGVVDFGFTDIVEGHNFLAVKIASVAGAGTLRNGATVLTGGETVSVAAITAGDLTFTPIGDDNGVGYASFTFQVQDDGGTLNGGVDTDPTANTLTIDVNAVNDPPGGADKTVTTDEGVAYTFTAADFGFTDPVEGDGLQAVVITTAPGAGTLRNGVTVLTGGETVSLAAITAGDLTFTPTGDTNGAGYASFTFQVQDDGSTANGGVDTDPTPNTITVDVNAVNDPPSGADKTVSTDEDVPYAFTAADFGFSDPVEGDSLQTVIITTAPAAGTLRYGALVLTGGETVPLAAITAGDLVFTPAGEASGVGYASFTFQVQDDGGTANGGVDTDATPNTITIDVNALNDAPVLSAIAPNLLGIDEDQTGNGGQTIASIVGASITDVDTLPSEGVAVTALASGNGTWEYSTNGGGLWTAIGSVSNASALLLRDNDLVRFVPDGQNADAATFDYRAWDQTSGIFGTKTNVGTTGGITAYSNATDRARITVAAVNDSPGLGNATLASVLENTTDPGGASVGGLFGGLLTDVDAGASLAGVAVVANGAPGAQGVWQYSSDGGGNWFAIGGVADGSARALGSGTLVRFLPAADYTGSPAPISVRALDDTYGGGFSSTAGGVETPVTIDASGGGGTSPIAGTTATVATSVVPDASLPELEDATPDPGDPPVDPLPDLTDEPVEDPPEEPAEEPADEPAEEAAESADDEPAAEAAAALGEDLTAANLLFDLADPLEVVRLRSTTAAADEGALEAGHAERDDDPTIRVERSILQMLEQLANGDLSFLTGDLDFVRELDQARSDSDSETLFHQQLIGSGLTLTAGLSIGYVVWLTRGGLLIASLASSMPVWRLIDPIPVLASLAMADGDQEEDESLASMVGDGSSGTGDAAGDGGDERSDAAGPGAGVT